MHLPARLTSLHFLIAVMLLMLHTAIWSEQGTLFSRAILLAHLGTFLIWQPVWKRDQKVDPFSAFLFGLFTFAFVTWVNWFTMFIWILLLISMVGGRVFVEKRDRYVYRLTLIFLITELLIGCITQMYSVKVEQVVVLIFEYALLLPPLIILFIPEPTQQRSSRISVDFLRGLTLSLMTSALSLGSLLVMYSSNVTYTEALLQTILALGLFLLLIGWLLSPHAGFSGLEQVWSRYVMNISTPFEQWLTELSRVAELYNEPNKFVTAAMDQFAHLTWVAGVDWHTHEVSGKAGSETSYATEIMIAELGITLYTRRRPGATLLLHAKLLLQVIAIFHSAKLAQQELTKQAHLQAIHETGARITHDIKNLLQSLHTLSTAVQSPVIGKEKDLQALLRRQLPLLTQRLQLALDKLASADSDQGNPIEIGNLKDWWQALQQRHEASDFEFIGDVQQDAQIPVECFDNVVENLLENARVKQQSEPRIAIKTTLLSDENNVVIQVTDNGNQISQEKQSSLFRMPVDSANGLGIGLYQASKLALSCGYALTLQDNEDGKVSFMLAREGEKADSPPAPE